MKSRSTMAQHNTVHWRDDDRSAGPTWRSRMFGVAPANIIAAILVLTVMALAGCGSSGGSPATGGAQSAAPTSTTRPANPFTEFPLSGNATGAAAMTVGPDGNLWFTETNTNTIGRLTPAGQITEFPLPQSIDLPIDITAGPDGNLWLALQTGIGRITPAGQITEFPVQSSHFQGTIAITTGPDGNLWFTEQGSDKVGRITPTGQITEFPLLKADSRPTVITAGPDGNLWFLDTLYDLVERITPDGQVTEFPIPDDAYPIDITAGPDGNLWFTESTSSSVAIGRITPSGEFSIFPLAFPIIGLAGITVGPDKNLWFTSPGDNQHYSQIGRMTPKDQQITATEINIRGSRPDTIITGPDGNLWFTDSGLQEIIRFTPGK